MGRRDERGRGWGRRASVGIAIHTVERRTGKNKSVNALKHEGFGSEALRHRTTRWQQVISVQAPHRQIHYLMVKENDERRNKSVVFRRSAAQKTNHECAKCVSHCPTANL